MATSANILQAVQTYQKSSLGRLQNMYCFLARANKKFKDFNNFEGNLGSTILFDKPTRAYAYPGLVVSTFDTVEQRTESLQVGGYDSAGAVLADGSYDKYGNLNAANTNLALSAQQLIFNIDNNDYRKQLEDSCMAELGANIEISTAANIVPGTYRFYTPGLAIDNTPLPITSYQQMASALTKFRNYGAVTTDTEVFMSDLSQSDIVGSGLSQFVPKRNEASANSWEVGNYSRAEFFTSNLLPVHVSGSVGNNQDILTVTSVTTDADGGISAITCSGASTDTVLIGDVAQFSDGVSGQANVRYLTFTGHAPSANPVQFQITANATGVAGNITLSIYPKLYSAAGKNKNVSRAITAGMQILVQPTHRAGLICSGKPLYLAMPRLPDQEPFPTANSADPDTGASIRMTKGAAFGQNIYGFIYDQIWGVKLVSEYAMRIIYPLSQ
jgi:hypothetical protein